MRLDAALVAQGLARSRGQARDLIDGGRVTVNGRPAAKASLPVGPDDTLAAETDPWVSRAAHKLLGALDASGTEVAGCRALDAGASTGGFTQVLLARGAEHVTAVDVGHGQLAEPVASDPRVTSHEGLNLRDLTPAHVAAPVDLVVADVSFISLTLLVAPLRSVARDGAVALLMVKPQFELGRAALDSRGVVADPARVPEAADLVARAAAEAGWREVWRGLSPLPGESGNREVFLKLVAEPGAVGPAR
ncbi:TlyA family RNA methyltransferase [Propioniciclava sp. MC1595]|uniref:TlyA family RNA methyltransferase n=1 Tax=Propioniciclava sp. MC1595 TaxID=2760308 RepID=UPI00166232EC|nr:TlyA family RNA methyltransferase [Propioniciclava sp. MC1595]MBB1495695.1 TlyA family RNA methyltransferase [Propioniciclava sp. MC1595]NLE17207.1 TlyA family RNA methyltransferase [Propioniciclava sp.]QTE24842.1 TlyA family RNA methyltransferase [Propioniciclava sp. MC1595]